MAKPAMIERANAIELDVIKAIIEVIANIAINVVLVIVHLCSQINYRCYKSCKCWNHPQQVCLNTSNE